MSTSTTNPAAWAKSVLSSLLRAQEGANPLGGEAIDEFPWERPLGGMVITLRDEAGRVRGSVGTTQATSDGGRLLRELVESAASHDPRFPPLLQEEVDSLQVQLWVLGPPRKVHGLEDFGPDDALWVRQGWIAGLFLPDLYVGATWEPLSYLAQACRRAGLDAYAPLDPTIEKRAFPTVAYSSD